MKNNCREKSPSILMQNQVLICWSLNGIIRITKPLINQAGLVIRYKKLVILIPSHLKSSKNFPFCYQENYWLSVISNFADIWSKISMNNLVHIKLLIIQVFFCGWMDRVSASECGGRGFESPFPQMSERFCKSCDHLQILVQKLLLHRQSFS